MAFDATACETGFECLSRRDFHRASEPGAPKTGSWESKEMDRAMQSFAKAKPQKSQSKRGEQDQRLSQKSSGSAKCEEDPSPENTKKMIRERIRTYIQNHTNKIKENTQLE